MHSSGLSLSSLDVMKRTGIRLTSLIVLAMLFGCSGPAASQSASETYDDKVLMAIFAHPDDEGTVAPLLTKYARQGAEVILVVATDGRLGTNDFSGLEAGDGLAALRHEEMKCAASKLGVELIHLDYEDQFGSAKGYDGFIPQLRGLIRDLNQIIHEKQPDVILTWGPDGGSNHMDHRLVGSSVTQVLVSQDWEKTPAVYYVGRPASSVSEEDRVLRGVQEKYLTIQVPYSEEDGMTALEALSCHKSQIPPESIQRRREGMRESEKIVYFRPFTAPTIQSEDLFRTSPN